ncbi:hypothetical protein [Flavobacterium flavigenum]|uniref:hypothetical protein n=1 Tax=Flavobacterium flavigenum TaxID=3003258 RepID=UPI0022AC87B0|nr:hypothetical protein [Flavobacterium flavigenum]
MIDLTRRNFIKNVGFVGTATLFCGSSLLSQTPFPFFIDSDNEDENILSFFSKSNSSDALLADAALLECYKKASENLKKTGYKPSGTFCFSSPDNQLKMFPMHLQVNGAGKLDDLLLCLGKKSNGEWILLKSLSGFDLEAMKVAMKELKAKNSTLDLTNYLFPAPVNQLNPYGFETKSGSVFLKTQLCYDQTSTKIVVKEGSNIVFEKEVISQHSLTVNSVLV